MRLEKDHQEIQIIPGISVFALKKTQANKSLLLRLTFQPRPYFILLYVRDNRQWGVYLSLSKKVITVNYPITFTFQPIAVVSADDGDSNEEVYSFECAAINKSIINIGSTATRNLTGYFIAIGR